MKSIEGMEAPASGKFSVKLSEEEKEVYGIIDGHKVLLTWNTKGKNPKWKEEAIKRYINRTRWRKMSEEDLVKEIREIRDELSEVIARRLEDIATKIEKYGKRGDR